MSHEEDALWQNGENKHCEQQLKNYKLGRQVTNRCWVSN
jgi:hypothetical protein